MQTVSKNKFLWTVHFQINMQILVSPQKKSSLDVANFLLDEGQLTVCNLSGLFFNNFLTKNDVRNVR